MEKYCRVIEKKNGELILFDMDIVFFCVLFFWALPFIALYYLFTSHLFHDMHLIKRVDYHKFRIKQLKEKYD